jgi:thioredoxin 1
MISPMIDRIEAAYAGKLKVGKMDVDANSASPSSLGVRSLPTLMLFKGGKMADQIIGMVSEVQLKKAIDKVIG